MPFCTNCGKELSDGEKFCPNCGAATGVADNSKRTSVYDGELHKCPNCGEILKSFEINCPACGYELRSVKASSAVKEFASKLEAIEAKREYEKPRGLFARAEALQRVSKADEQKISLIKSFAVPNSKEDILEFMILATSSINLNAYDNTSGTVTKSDKELNAAWLAKVEQVFEKARRSFSTDNTFGEIEYLYKKCQEAIKKKKKKVLIKWILMVGWIPLAWIILIAGLLISGPKDEAAELDRLDAIVSEVQDALEHEEFSHALRIADSIDYQRYDVEMERKWDIEREYWVEKVLTEASAHGVELEYTPTDDIDNAND